VSLLIRHGRLIDPSAGLDRRADLFISGDKVVSLDQAPAGFVAERVIDASGKLVVPGLVDLAPACFEERAAWVGGITCTVTPQGFVASTAEGMSAASGAYAFRLGLSSAPIRVETEIVDAVITSMRYTRKPAHIGRLSSAASLAMIRSAKQEGLPITCDVSINHLHLTDVDIGYYDSRFRLDPPLRGQRDRDAIRVALKDGTIDALCSAHTMVDLNGKTKPFALAQPGASGVELLLSLALKWADQEQIALLNALSCVTSRPAEIGLGYSAGLAIGATADLCVVDHEMMWTVNENNLNSASCYTPFAGMGMPGSVEMTIKAGQIVWERA